MTDFKPNIWRLQAQLDTQGLIQALKNEDPGIRRRAAAALHALGATEAVPTLREALDRETDTEVRANLVAALAHLSAASEQKAEPEPDAPNPVARLIAQLNADTPDRIIEATRALGELKDKLAVEPLINVFRSVTQPPLVRLAAAEALLALESAPAEVTLLGALRSKQWHLRRNAAAILGQLRADWAVIPLGRTLKDENELVVRTARAALKRMGTPEALKILADNPEAPPAPRAVPLTAASDKAKTQPHPPDNRDALVKAAGYVPDDPTHLIRPPMPSQAAQTAQQPATAQKPPEPGTSAADAPTKPRPPVPGE